MEAKVQRFGDDFLGLIKAWVEANPCSSTSSPSSSSSSAAVLAASTNLNGTQKTTYELFCMLGDVERVARDRGLVVSTVYGHLAEAIK